MDLLLDIGNTNVKWAPYAGGEIGRVSSREHRSGDLGPLEAQWRGLQRPDRILAANVAGDGVGAGLQAVARRCWRRDVEFVRTRKTAHGVTIAYAQPERLGVDRWLALLAVNRWHSCPALVVDCGTAATLDVIDAEGRHLGGLIVPGLNMMWTSLFQRTRIPDVAPEEFDGLLGKDTGQCISAGSVQALVGMIERVWRRLKEHRGWEARIILSGSDGPRVAGLLDRKTTYRPDLVLRGLTLLTD